ncbi:hypothetical protein [Maribacter halichondriae]|uniref:hypothetical protein n=1 Tax=Maribacter halichondriae TaxID=2980554 RepID=UPI002359CC4C|nr:hypothetical protein [Maribacter sp. Hal144]
MQKYYNILVKLNRFTKRYYTKMLVKGTLLFLVFGLLFFFIALGVEYFLWLNSTGRFLLLMAFVVIEVYLLFRYILTPAFYLFKIKKGISKKQASVMIGMHFPEVGDKLLNLLDLAEDQRQTELLLASIEQRSENLDPIPFVKAVDFKESWKYSKYLVIPALILGLIWFSGNIHTFFGSYERVVNYDIAYEPPAPFRFTLLSPKLDVLESEPYTAQVVTEGEVRPEDVYIVVDGQEFLLQEQSGMYQHVFSPPLKNVNFHFRANGIKSKEYRLNVLKAPSIQDFKLVLEYPGYINKRSETLKSTGNATFPEGTKVTWQIEGQHTDGVDLITKDTTVAFEKDAGEFGLSKRIYANFAYQIATSNQNVTNYEKLEYQFSVIKDAYPSIKANQVLDSLNPNVSYYVGEASDDYKLSKIRLVCFSNSVDEDKQTIELAAPNTNFDQFYYTFPSGLQLEEGKQYSFYFEAVDNDAMHKGKSSKSQVFTTQLLNEDQLRNKELESQQSIINNMDKSLEKFKEQKETLEEINAEQKEKSQLNFNDQNQIKDFLKKQQQQENLMQKFSKQLKENLDKENTDDKLNQLLKERLERQELEAKKNEKLLEELNKIADKIDKEELAKRLEELAKKQQNSERSLEQLLELTKRYYVTEKASQLAKDLEKLAKNQDVLSELKLGEEFSNKEQEKLNNEFENIAEELEELKEDNKNLKKPLDLEVDEPKTESIKKDQQEALEEINKHQGAEESSQSSEKQESANKAKQKQKSAAQKMKEMSEQLGATSSSSGGGSTTEEDAEMLRQVLDNLITFSFKQENLFESIETEDREISQFSGTVRKQQELRDLFEHVDDSLFALSLRRAELSEFVNEQITEVYYNIDKSLESLAESQIYQGVSYQKYVLNASNSLADFLAKILDNMQQNMQMGQGEGEGQDFQLPDIIKGQGEVKEKMEGMGKSGEGKPQQGEGEPKPGEGNQPGEGEKPGEGQKGESGQDGQKGNNGKDGKNGNGQTGGQDGQSGGQGGEQPSEEELKEIYEIYKTQQMLRQQLEQQLQDMINTGDRKLGEKLIRQMEDFENDLLENGVTQRSLSKINNIQYELLKLENAALKQGKKNERESNTNENRFQNPITTKPSLLENYRNEIEILNRQALPLRQNFQTKVKEYFKRDD